MNKYKYKQRLAYQLTEPVSQVLKLNLTYNYIVIWPWNGT